MSFAAFKQSHLATFLFLLPFVTLLCVHDALGLSDAFLLVKDQRDLDSRAYNVWMMVALGFGVAGFSIHTAALAHRSKAWLYAKLAFLTGGWTAIALLR